MSNKRYIKRLLSNIEPENTSHNIGLKQVLLANDETLSSVTQIAVTELKKGEKVEMHVHKTMDEHYLFYSGKGLFIIDTESLECQRGLFLLIPAGTPHGILAHTQLKFLTIGIALE
ncbi:MAG: cupin domain-containing protein [Bacteroidota bacterium]|nr:cupin domain-containing protein [Bacteroidota bacterium]